MEKHWKTIVLLRVLYCPWETSYRDKYCYNITHRYSSLEIITMTIKFNLPWNTLQTSMKYPENPLETPLKQTPLKSIWNFPEIHLPNTLETHLQLPWNTLQSSFKHPWHFLKHSWNFLETHLKHLWNTIETSLTHPFNFFQIPFKTTKLLSIFIETLWKHPWNFL